jgi:hypothetical protein
MKLFASIVAALCMSFAGAGAALADYRYDIKAIDDVDGDATFIGSMITSAPFSLAYNFSVLSFDLNYLTKGINYQSSNSTLVVEAQGFHLYAKDASSDLILTLYPDSSYFSEYTVAGQNTFNDSGYFLFSENVAAIPEPASYALLLVGLGMFGFLARRKQKAAV